MNPIFAQRKDHEEPPAPDIQMSPEMQHYSLDTDHDGRVQPDDFEQARGRITAPVDDPAKVSREVKRLRADDILAERARRREEVLNEAIIEEDRQRLKMENRGPARKMAGRVGDFAIGMIKSIPAAQPAPQTRGRAPARAPTRGQMRPAPAPASMGQRFTGVNNAANNFGMSLMPSGGQPRGFTLQARQGGDHLQNFTRSMLGGAPAPKPQAQAPRRSPHISIYVNDTPIPKKNMRDNPVNVDKSPARLKNDFMGSMLFGGKTPAPSRAPARSQAPARKGGDMLKNFGKNIGGVSMAKGKGKGKKPNYFGGF